MNMLRIALFILLALNALAFAGIKGWLGTGASHEEHERISSQLNPERIRLATDSPAQGLQAPIQAAAPAYDVMAERFEPPPAAVTDPEEQSTATASVPTPAIAAVEAEAGTVTEDVGLPPPAPTEAAAEQPNAAEPPFEPPVAATPASSCVAWSGLSEANADAITRRLRRSGADPERSRIETPNSWWVRVPPQGSRTQAERRVEELRTLGVKDTFIVQEPGPTQFAVSLGVFKTEARARVLLNQLRNQGVRNAGVEPRMSTSYRIQATLPADAVRGVESSVPGIARNRTTCPRR